MRIAKYISNSGVCSRREAEKLIKDGEVYINKVLCKKPNVNVDLEDEIKVKKKIIKFNKYIRVWKLYKPIKVICSNRDLQKRTTIFDILPKNIPRVISVGRLDFYSEGLIILTNNGDLARNLELPSSNILRVYHLCILGNIEKKMIQKINHGVSINKIFYKKISVQIQKKQKDCTWLLFKLREGKNREIRNICNFFNWKILKLIRVQYGSIKLSGLEPGKVKEVKNYINKPC